MNIDPNQLVLLGIALASAAQAYFAWKTRGDIHTLEVNTNSIKDALVKRTAEASEAKGRDEQRIVGERTAAAVARGLAGGRAGVDNDQPLPVADDRTASAAERSAAATERVATATEERELK